MRNASIYTKIFSIVGIFCAGFAIYVGVVHTSMKDTLEQSDYRELIVVKDFKSDSTPTPLYVFESFMVALQLGRESDTAKLSALRVRWKKLESDFNDRRRYWMDHLEAGGLRSAFETAQKSAERLFAAGDEQLLPAIDSKDSARIAAALDNMHTITLEHRADIDEVVRMADKEASEDTAHAADTIHSRKLGLLGLGLAIAVVGGLVAASIGRMIANRARAMANVVVKIGDGDLTQRVELTASDELGEMAAQLNRSLDAVESAFIDVKRVAVGLAEAGAALSRSAEQISSGAQQQAASLEETAASLEEITATVKQSAGNAQQANQVAMGSRDVAERGGGVVAEAVGAMNQITQASRQIGDIITTIDEIALQTNLLALNAAVEAARAGEQGRGFAVVAAEVGNLAQRSAAAAKEVKALISDTLQRVETGHRLVGESGRSLSEIITSVKQVTDIVGEIAAASHEQSTGVDQVNQAVSQMDQVTQSNAAQTQGLTRTAEGLAGSAADLRELVMRFKLSGDATEAPHSSRDRTAPTMMKLTNKRPANRQSAAEPEHALRAAGNGRAPAQAHEDSGADFEVL